MSCTTDCRGNSRELVGIALRLGDVRLKRKDKEEAALATELLLSSGVGLLADVPRECSWPRFRTGARYTACTRAELSAMGVEPGNVILVARKHEKLRKCYEFSINFP